MASFDRSLLRVKRDLDRYLPARIITQAAEAAGCRWRKRVLDPVLTVQLFILQVLHFNTSLTHMRHLAARLGVKPVTPSALCQARTRLPLAVMQKLLRSLCDTAGVTGLFHGHKLWTVDGSSASLPDTPELQETYPQPKVQRAGCGFPLMKTLALFDAATGLLMNMIPTSLHAHEQSGVWQLHPLIRAGDILLGDRGLCSFWHLAMLQTRQILGIFRMHQCQIVSFRKGRRKRRKGEKGKPASRWVKRLGKHDQLVEWHRPRSKPKWMDTGLFATMPQRMLVRELRYTIVNRGQRTRRVTIATTLLDPIAYPKDQIAWLYGVRWEVETHFKQLKTTLKMRVLKCQSVQGVNKELLAFALAYNLVRLTMNQAARRQGVDVERISFIDTLRWLITARADEALPELLINPLRPDRIEPRVIKRRAMPYDLMNRPRSELRQRLTEKRDAA